MKQQRTLVAGFTFFLGYVLLLVTVPYWVPLAPDVASAAAVEGYNNNIAFLAMAGWSAVGVLLFALGGVAGWFGSEAAPEERRAADSPHPFTRRHAVELLLVFIGVCLLYFPFFLARYGPFTEEQVFLTALHRMMGGQKPYVNFEFLYSPLMLYLAYGWTRLFGYSLTSYYAYMALLEAVPYTLLLAVLQRVFPQPRQRYLAFLLISSFLLNVLLAPNQNGLRKLIAIFGLLLIAERPDSWRRVLPGGLLLGLQLAYSHDYGLAGVAAMLALYGWLFLRSWHGRYLLYALGAGAAAGVVWVGLTLLVMGGDFPAYLTETLYLLGRFGAGEAGFRFYWTANGLALFALLALAGTLVGSGLFRQRKVAVTAGDALLFTAVVYALVALKSGLNRSDLWHLDPGFLLLLVAFVWPWPRRVFAVGPWGQRLAVGLLLLAGTTYLFGLLPNGSHVARGWWRGLVDTAVAPIPPGAALDIPIGCCLTRAPTIELERSHPRPEILQLADYLAQPDRANAPVLFYGDLWSLGVNIGVYKTDLINDDFLYSDERGLALRQFLIDRPTALVIIRRPLYDRLYGLADPHSFPEMAERFSPTLAKQLGGWLSTIHYHGVEMEQGVREQRWTRTVGVYVRDHYQSVAEFGDMLVLAPTK